MSRKKLVQLHLLDQCNYRQNPDAASALLHEFFNGRLPTFEQVFHVLQNTGTVNLH